MGTESIENSPRGRAAQHRGAPTGVRRAPGARRADPRDGHRRGRRKGGRKLKRLNDELAALKTELDKPLPHPGHPTTGRSSEPSTKTTGDAYGRVQGLGAEFVKALGGVKALDATSGGATMPSSFFDRRLRELPQRRGEEDLQPRWERHRQRRPERCEDALLVGRVDVAAGEDFFAAAGNRDFYRVLPVQESRQPDLHRRL
jgi:hypothetical protein